MARNSKQDTKENAGKDNEKETGIKKTEKPAEKAAPKAEEKPASDKSEKESHDRSAAHKPSSNKRRLITIAAIMTAVILCVASAFIIYRSLRHEKPEEEETPAVSLITDDYVWSNEVDGATFYYEFKDDGAFVVTVGSIEYRSQYEKVEDDDQLQLGVDLNIGSFRSKETAGYADCSLSDDADTGAQTLTCSYDNDSSFTLQKVQMERVQPEPEDGFSPVQSLLGTWNARQEDGSQQVVFHEDGTMEWSLTDSEGVSSATYSGSYSFEEDAVIFTYYAAEKTVVQLKYTLDGDRLNILGSDFVREGADAD